MSRNISEITELCRSKALALIAAYNEEENIAQTIDEVSLYVSEIIVVDDGSRDHTESIARAKQVKVIRHKKNQGKGKALRTGMKAAIKMDTEWIITIDADLQHDPAEIPRLVHTMLKTQADCVIGNRQHDPLASKTMNFSRRFANMVTSGYFRQVFGVKVSDLQCGYRCYSVELVRNVLPCLKKNHFDLETEILIESWIQQYTIVECPVRMVYSQEIVKKSHMRPLLDTYRWFMAVLERLTEKRTFQRPWPDESIRFSKLIILFEVFWVFLFLLAIFL
ncbi:MAG: glycosyltransferase family 2 protein [Promethearchaeota archaeon]